MAVKKSKRKFGKKVSRWIREQKDKHRLFAMVKRIGKKAYKVIIVLPSDSCEDLKLGLKLGTITKDTFVIAIEKEPKYAKDVAEYLKSHFKRWYLYTKGNWGETGEFKDLNLDGVLRKNEKIDFAFLDFCDNLNTQISGWLSLNRHHFSDNAKIAITIKAVRRRKENLEKGLIPHIKGPRIELLDDIISNTKNNLSSRIFTNDINVEKIAQNSFFRKVAPIKKVLSRANVITSTKVSIFALANIFYDSNVRFERISLYRDTESLHSEMVYIEMYLDGSKVVDTETLNYKDMIKKTELTMPNNRRMLHKGVGVREYAKKGVTQQSLVDKYNITKEADIHRANTWHKITSDSKVIANANGSDWEKKRKQMLGGIRRSLTVRGL